MICWPRSVSLIGLVSILGCLPGVAYAAASDSSPNSAVTQSGGAQDADVKLTLIVFNHAHVNAKTLAAAENATSTIFRRVGVRLVWRDGFAYAAELRNSLNPPS